MSGKTVLAIILFSCSGLLLAQQASPTPEATKPANSADAKRPSTLSVSVNVVNVPATVRDKHGKIVSDLGKDDFVLEEDGRPQTIRYFAHETDLPLTLGLLVDTSLSQRRVLEDERHASYSFLDQMLHQKDLAFVIHFDHQVELLQDLTASREKLDTALQGLQTTQPVANQQQGGNQGGNNGGQTGGSYPGGGYPGRGRHGGGGGHGMSGGGTLLYDATYLASDELMKKQQGRKAIIILSDGVDRGSKVGLDTAIATAQKSDTVVYCILFKDDEPSNPGFGGRGGFGGGMGRRGGRFPQEYRPDGKKILEQISKETGGQVFEVSKKEPIDKIYQSIAEDLRNQYSLGYTPDQPGSEGSYHKIILKTKKKDFTVQARDGYYSTHASTQAKTQ